MIECYMGIESKANKLVPMSNHGVQTMSMGYLLRECPARRHPKFVHLRFAFQHQARITTPQSSGEV
jgi:hypothetical protein